METKKHHWLYVLKLESGKYYVGITAKTPELRFKEHVSGYTGAAWTRKHKPIKIISSMDLGVVTRARAEEFENRVVRKYIGKYGIGSVRGGDLRSKSR